MSKGPRMGKSIKQFIEECLTVNLALKNGYHAEKTAIDLLCVVKVYCLLTTRKPLVQDIVYEKHLSSGLGEKGLAKKTIVGSLMRLKEVQLEYLHFTDLGLAYQKIYKEELELKGQSWLDFSVRVLEDTNYYYGLLETVEDYEGCLKGSPVVSHAASQHPIPIEQEEIVIYEGSVGELKERADRLFKELNSLCASMEKKSNDMIIENGMTQSTSQNAVHEFMLSSHRKYYQGSRNNKSKLKEIVIETEQGFNDALTVMGLIEGLYK